MRCRTHPILFNCERTSNNSSRGSSWKYAEICFACEKKIAKFHNSKGKPGKSKSQEPIVVKMKK